jgi:hypothetical protein
MNQTNPKKMKILDDQEAFYFHTSIGNYTGHKAHSLKEFEHELFKVDLNSLEFHLFREDFEKWIRFSLKEEALAKKVEALRKQKVTGKLLRNWLYTHIRQHIKTLNKPHKSSATSKATLKNKNFRQPASAHSS